MRKLINDPFACVDKMIGGLQVAFPGLIEVTTTGRGLVFTKPAPGQRTAIVTGGGRGTNRRSTAISAVAWPTVPRSATCSRRRPPSRPSRSPERLRLLGAESVLFVYGNYDGDIMNFGMAADFLADRGIPCETVLVTDDVASAPASERSDGTASRAMSSSSRPPARRPMRAPG